MSACGFGCTALVLAASLSSCAPASPEGLPEERIGLVRKAEVDEIVRQIAATARVNRELHCPSPVLHGEPLPGPADDDLRAIFRPTGDVDACYDVLTALSEI